MNGELDKLLRTIHHVTSLEVAEKILDSCKIWSKDTDGAANFHPNQTSNNKLDVPDEICLEFYWDGLQELVCFDYDIENLGKAGVLYHYVTTDIDSATIDNVKIWASKICRGTSEKLTCVKAVPFRDFLERTERDSILALRFESLKSVAMEHKTISVPTDAEITEITNGLKAKKKGFWRLLFCRV